MSIEYKSLGEALPAEIKRVGELRDLYLAIGPAGIIGATMMKLAIEGALAALSSGDVIAMIHAYKDLQGFKSE